MYSIAMMLMMIEMAGGGIALFEACLAKCVAVVQAPLLCSIQGPIHSALEFAALVGIT